jgi:hypothetical protein
MNDAQIHVKIVRAFGLQNKGWRLPAAFRRESKVLGAYNPALCTGAQATDY